MRVLIVARRKENGYAPFVSEQVETLEKAGILCEYFPMQSKGIKGYLRELPAFRHRIREFKPNVIHAHYGLCGLFANLQRKVPVVTTYHGSDINDPSVLWLSKLAMHFSAYNVFVSKNSIALAKPTKSYALIPCGINLEDFPIIEKSLARQQFGMDRKKKYVLFAGAFDNTVKNAPLAKAAVAFLPEVELLELRGYSRNQVAVLMQAVDALLVTSFSEGSPQVIKEALACGCPIVSVDVGDVAERVTNVDGCYIDNAHTPISLAELLKRALVFGRRTEGRKKLVKDGLGNEMIAASIIALYKQVSREECS